MLVRAKIQLTVTRCGSRAKVLRIVAQSVECQLFELGPRFKDVNIARPRREVDLSIRDDGRGVITSHATASTFAAATGSGFPSPFQALLKDAVPRFRVDTIGNRCVEKVDASFINDRCSNAV